MSQASKRIGHPGSMKLELIRGVGASVVLRAVGAAMSLAVSVTLARVLGVQGYGIYVFCLAVVSLMAIPAQFGIGTVLVRFCSAYEKQRRWGMLKGLLQWGNRFVLISSAVLVAIASLVLLCFPNLAPDGSTNTLWWALVALPVLALGELRAAALRGLRKFITGQLPEALLQPGALLLIVLVILSIRPDLSATGAMIAHIAASLLAFFLGAFWLWRAVPRAVKDSEPEYDQGTWLGAMGTLSLTRGGRVALGRMDVIFVGALAGAEAAGIYRVASALAGLVAFGLNAINGVIGPYFSRLHVSGERKKIGRLLALSCGGLALISIPIALVLAVLGDTIIEKIYGSEFTAAWLPLSILAIGQVVNGITGPVGTLTNMTGQERWALIAVACTLFCAIPAYLVLVPSMGVTGAALASACALVILNGALSARIWYWLMAKEEQNPAT